jgi:nucleotide-binding universal stress UspA family protein
MSSRDLHPFKVVVALDRSDAAAEVLERALDEAARHSAAEVHVISVLEPPRYALRRQLEESSLEIDRIRERLRSFVSEEIDAFGGARPGWRVQLHVRAGHPAPAIAELAADVEADLVVCGRYGVKGRRSAYVGPVTEELLRMAHAPVLIAQSKDYGPHETPLQCPMCVAVRRDSDGNQWFCARHHADHPLTGTIVLTGAPMSTGGGAMY